jgi:N-acetylneuraminic acid mutarotase
LIVALLTATEFTLFSANASTGDFWVAKAPIPSSSNEFFDSVVLNGKVYVIGTNITASADNNPNYMYDPATNTWTQKAPMPYFQEDFGLTTYQGQIYVIGGSFYVVPTATIQVYNPTTDSWSNSTELQLPAAEAALSAVTVNGKIYVMGGAITGLAVPIPIGINEVYDPNSNTWNTLANMPAPVIRFAMTGVGDKIYVMGGGDSNNGQGFSNETQIYDTQTNTWPLVHLCLLPLVTVLQQ